MKSHQQIARELAAAGRPVEAQVHATLAVAERLDAVFASMTASPGSQRYYGPSPAIVPDLSYEGDPNDWDTPRWRKP